MPKIVYLDNQATTPIDPKVLEAMGPYLAEHFGNPGSKTHNYGIDASLAVEKARSQIADLINANPNEVIFTSGTTESNNIVIQGLVNNLKKANKSHLITSKIEHKSVLEVFYALEKAGFEVTYLTPKSDGTLDLPSLVQAIKSTTGLISIMHANNEIGNIYPIESIGAIAEERGILFHCDGAQTIGKFNIDVKKLKVDFLTFSAHKIYGPKGIGAVYIKDAIFNKLSPVYHGGGQEKGLRPGTLSPFLIVGFAEALKISSETFESEFNRISELKSLLLSGILNNCSDIQINGSSENRLANNLNLSFLGIPSDTLMMNLLDKIAVSNGSACTSYEPTYSYVLKAMDLDKERIESAIRFGIGRFTTKEDIEFAIDCISSTVIHLRKKLISCNQN